MQQLEVSTAKQGYFYFLPSHLFSSFGAKSIRGNQYVARLPATQVENSDFFNAFVQENDLFNSPVVIDIFVESADLIGGYIVRKPITFF